MIIGDVIIGYDFIIDASDRVEQTIGGTRMNNNLATICNLSQAVVKNADKTMKITYTLTEQVVSS